MGNIIYKAAFNDTERDVAHFRTAGSKNGVRIWQNKDGSYTEAGRTSKPGGRYNQSLNHRIDTIKANRTERLAKGTGEYAERKQSQGFFRQGVNSVGDLAAAGRDVAAGKMSVGDAFKVYGGTAAKALAVTAGAAALTGAAAYGYYQLQNKLGINYEDMNGLQQIMYNTGDAVDAYGQLGKYKANELIDNAKLAGARILSDPKAALTSAGDAVKSTASSLGTKASGLYGDALLGVQNAGESVKNAVGNAANNVKNFANQVSDEAAMSGRSVPATLAGMVGSNVSSTANGVKNSIQSAVSNAPEYLRDAEHIAKTTIGAAKQRANAIGSVIGNSRVGQTVSNTAKNIGTGIYDTAARANAAFGNTAVGNAINNGLTDAKMIAGNYLDAAKTYGQMAGNKLGQVANDAKVGAARTITDALNSAEQFAANPAQYLQSAARDATNLYKTAIGSAASRANAIGQKLGNEASAFLNNNPVGQNISNVASKVGNVASTVGNVVNPIATKVGNLASTVGNRIVGAGQYAGQAANSAANAVKNDLSEGANTVSRWANDTGLTSKFQNAGNAVSNAANSVKNAVGNAASSVRTGNPSGWSSRLADVADDGSGFTTNLGLQNGRSMENYMNELFEAYGKQSSGTATPQSVANGIANAVGNATGATKSQIQNVASEIANKLGGNSGNTSAWSTYGQYAPQQTINNPTTYGANGVASQIRSTGQGSIGKYGSGAQNYRDNADAYAQAAANAPNVSNISEQDLWEWYKMLS